MKFVQIIHEKEVKLGIQTAKGIILFEKLANPKLSQIKTLKEYIIKQNEQLNLRFQLSCEIERYQGQYLDCQKIEYAPIIDQPNKIICIGLNYRSHILETKRKEEAFPEFFAKTTNSLNAHHQVVFCPKSVHKLDYEAELVMIVGKAAYEIPEDKASDYIWGYTIGNDISARDLQKRRTQWYLGKSLDGFAPIGPCAVEKSNFNIDDAKIYLKRNEQVVQKANVNQLIFKPEYLLSHISQYMTLKPGDLIFTGTPEGVIMGKETPDWLSNGETLAVTIEGIGTLINQVKIKEN